MIPLVIYERFWQKVVNKRFSMKIENFKCPNCGADLVVPDDKKEFFCTYCGSQIKINENISKVEVLHIHRDEARLRELEHTIALEKEQKKLERKRSFFFKLFYIGLVVFLLACFFYPKSSVEELTQTEAGFLFFIPGLLAAFYPPTRKEGGHKYRVGILALTWFIILTLGGFILTLNLLQKR